MKINYTKKKNFYTENWDVDKTTWQPLAQPGGRVTLSEPHCSKTKLSRKNLILLFFVQILLHCAG